jgi:hypothetical protein
VYKIYYDAEFTGLHRNSTLISIALKGEDNEYFYAEFTDYDVSQLNEWITTHVISKLQFKDSQEIRGARIPGKSYTMSICGDKDTIRDALNHWLHDQFQMHGDRLSIMTDCYAYDWMLLVDLLTDGDSALSMPHYISYIPIDLSTYFWSNGIDPDTSRTKFMTDNVESLYGETDHYEHNALIDVTVMKSCFELLNSKNLKKFIY